MITVQMFLNVIWKTNHHSQIRFLVFSRVNSCRIYYQKRNSSKKIHLLFQIKLLVGNYCLTKLQIRFFIAKLLAYMDSKIWGRRVWWNTFLIKKSPMEDMLLGTSVLLAKTQWRCLMEFAISSEFEFNPEKINQILTRVYQKVCL